MVDLVHDAALRIKGIAHTERFMCDTSALQTIYKGQPLIFNATDLSHAVAFVDAVVVAATDVFVGIAAEAKVVPLSGVEADQVIEVYVGPTILGFKSTVFTSNAKLGCPVYMSDSGTLSETVGDNPYLGTLWLIEDGYCYVKLSAPQICTGA